MCKLCGSYIDTGRLALKTQVIEELKTENDLLYRRIRTLEADVRELVTARDSK